MVIHGHRAACIAAAAILFAGCTSSGGNSAPRLSTLPNQTVTSGASVSVDLASYVSDKDSGGLSWTVVSGGGTFAGSTYSNTFATLGTYSVTVRVTDSVGNASAGTFDVHVTTAALAVVGVDDDLALLDVTTENVVGMTSAPGVADTFRTALTRGQVVYERTLGTNVDLYAFDTATRRTHTLGADTERAERYAGKTSTDLVVFVSGTASDTGVFLWNPATDFTRTIADGTGEHDRNPLVNDADLVFFERGAAGQSDIWFYDVAADTTTAVSTHANQETLRAVLPGGAAVFTRIGAGGESDLFWFRRGTGLVEIGSDLSTTVQAQTKTWVGSTADGKVVFEVAGATEVDLYVWNPANGESRLISGSDSGDATFAAVTALGEIVYHIDNGADQDLAIYRYATNARTIVASTAVDETWQAGLANGDFVYAVDSATGVDLMLFDTSADSSVTIAAASTSDYAFAAVLSDDTVVYTLAGGGLFVFSGGASTTVTAAPATFGGETANGSFVYAATAAAQTDLFLFSGGVTTSVSEQDGNDTFGAFVADKIVFTRVVSGQTTADLFVWTAVDGETRVTTTERQHSVVATFAADDS